MVQIDSRLQFEESIELEDNMTCIYFIGSKSLYTDLTGKNEDRCAGMTLSIEMPTGNEDPDNDKLVVSISPTEKDGDMLVDYDWEDIGLPTEEITALLSIWKTSKNKEVKLCKL